MTAMDPSAEGEPPDEISALIDILHKTDARIEELTGGEIDAVTDQEGRAFLLRHAQEHLRRAEEARQTAILNALPAHVAVLDPRGRITSVNEAWRAFGRANALLAPHSAVGESYLDACEGATGEDAAVAREVCAGIRLVLSGREDRYSTEYPCHSLQVKRWFLMTVSPLSTDHRSGAVIMHVDITAEKVSQQATVTALGRLTEAQRIGKIGDWEWDVETQAITWSPQVFEIFGRDPHLGPPSFAEYAAMNSKASRKLMQEKVALALTTGGPQEYDLVLPRSEGLPVHTHAVAVPRKDESGRVVGLFGTIQDISDRKRAEAALAASEIEFRTLAEAMPQMVWITRPDGWNVYFSQQWMDYTGLTLEESLGHGWNRPFHPEDQHRAWDAWRDATTSSGIYSIECRLRRADGIYRWWLIRGVPLLDPSGRIQKWFGTCTDIHDLKVAELKIAQSNRLYAVLSGINTLIVRVKKKEELFAEACRIAIDDGGFRMASIVIVEPTSMRILSAAAASQDAGLLETVNGILATGVVPHGMMLGQVIRESRPIFSNDAQSDAAPTLRAYAGTSVRSIAMLPLMASGHAIGVFTLFSSEKEFFHEGEMKLLTELAGDIAYCVSTIQAGREREEADLALRASLKEKEALLKEVHHRVKNNLQVIASLLRLESNRIDHAVTKGVLKDMQNRIQAMAGLHETLYRSGNFAQVDLAAYLKQLTNQLSRSLSMGPGRVSFHLSLVSVGLDLDQAIPCGLIVNELASNALKHAFPDGRSGEVRVELDQVQDGTLLLRVSDDGIGLPADFEARRGKSLGLQLVSDLARQLQGTFRIAPGPRAVFEVTFLPNNAFERRLERGGSKVSTSPTDAVNTSETSR
jgi:PAS domain S-box-containing protein